MALCRCHYRVKAGLQEYQTQQHWQEMSSLMLDLLAELELRHLTATKNDNITMLSL